MSRLRRRGFLKYVGTAATTALLADRGTAEDTPPPSELITVGVVGCGGRGLTLIGDFLRAKDARIVAVCDVHDAHYRDRAWAEGSRCGRDAARDMIQAAYASRDTGRPLRGVEAYTDYRALCARDDIDVVVVATPDHWHALVALEAMRRGKDVYCEKPVTHHFAEGPLLSREVAKHKAVFQAGSQQRSMPRMQHAVNLVRNGHLGKVTRVEVGLPTGYDAPQGDPALADPPEGLDYDLWCGPGEKLPYTRARHHRWWRGHRAFGGGVLMDWIGHHNDIAHWALGLDRSGPSKVLATGWTFPETDLYNTPQHYEVQSVYAGGLEISISDRHTLGAKWIGEDGWLHVNRQDIRASNSEWVKRNFDPGPIDVAGPAANHAADFLRAVKTRGACIAPCEVAHRSITPGHLAYVSHALGTELDWDAEAQKIVGNDAANHLLNAAPYRAPWMLT